MANRSEKSIQNGAAEVRNQNRVEGPNGGKVPQARQRVRYNKAGEELTGAIGTRFPKALYEEYKRIAFFRGVDVRDLIGEAMKAYHSELKKGYTQRLREAGMSELSIEN